MAAGRGCRFGSMCAPAGSLPPVALASSLQGGCACARACGGDREQAGVRREGEQGSSEPAEGEGGFFPDGVAGGKGPPLPACLPACFSPLRPSTPQNPPLSSLFFSSLPPHTISLPSQTQLRRGAEAALCLVIAAAGVAPVAQPRARARKSTHARARAHTHTHTRTYARTHAHTRTHTRTHTHTHSHTHTRARAHTHTQVQHARTPLRGT